MGEGEAKARILVVDDSKLMRKAALKMLGDEFDVVTGEDGEEAWTVLQADPSIQVVFTDLNMPRCDGYELLRRVRTAEDTGLQGLPVIVVTGAENDETARMQALDLGATDFISKPFTTTDLVARARAHASHRRVTRALQAQATLDALTGLLNKAGFLDRLQQDLAYSRRHVLPLSVVRLEIADFRRLFLYYGRDRAEALVLQVARLLRARIRKEDSVARIGLGGFALSLPGGQPAGIEGMLDRLRAELIAHAPVDDEGAAVPVVLMAGVLSPEAGAGDAVAVLARCEALLAALPASPTVAQPDAAGVVDPVVVVRADALPAETPAVAATAPDTVDTPLSAGAPDAAAAPEPEATPVPSPAPTPAATAAALRLDPLLDALAAGDAKPLQEKLPLAIGRLLPLFRLLGPNQRAQLVQFLQKLG